MPRFAAFNNLILSVRDSLEWCCRKSFAPESLFLKRALFYLRPDLNWSSPVSHSPEPADYWDDSQGFGKYLTRLYTVTSKHKSSSPEVISALDDLRAVYPVPHVEVAEEGVWNYSSVSVWTHLKSTFADAVANIEATGRTLSSDDKKYLQLLLTHSCGWSATYPERMNDHWANFFKISYAHLKGLVLILDPMTYEEELKDLPDGIHPNRAETFLLATPESYYVYDCSETPAGCDFGLSRAGNTLEEVYIGMKEWKFVGLNDDDWDVEDEVVCLDDKEYFPSYDRNENGFFCVYT